MYLMTADCTGIFLYHNIVICLALGPWTFPTELGILEPFFCVLFFRFLKLKIRP